MLIITEPFDTGKLLVYTRGWLMIQMVSTNIGQPNFKFCIRFYPTGAPGGGYIFIPYIATGNFLNVCELADNVVNWDRSLFDSTIGIYPSISNPQVTIGNHMAWINTNAVKAYTLEISEGFDVGGVFTIDTDNAETFPAFYIKGKITARQSGDGTALGDYYPPATASVNEGWLTWRTYLNSPWSGQRMFANAARAICLPTFTGHKCSFAHIRDNGDILAGCIATKYRYNLYDGETLIATQDITMPYNPSSTTAREKMLYCGIGLDNIEATDVALIPAIKKPSNFTGWTHYTIQMLSNSAQASQVIAMYHTECFTRPYTLRWTNDLGGVEHYTFDNGIQVTDEVERVQTYSHGQTESGAIWHRLLGEQTATSEVGQKIELQSKPITLAERRLLATIARSESLELWTPDGYTYPVTVDDRQAQYRLRENFQLDTFVVKLKFSSDAGVNI